MGNYNVKQVIVLRKDLNMRKGKMVAQGAHASMAVFFNLASVTRGTMHINLDENMAEWVKGSFAKICVSADSEEELLALYKAAQQADMPCSLIQDAGFTEFNGVPTYTAVAIGPAQATEIDKITGDLKLL